jgi:hypothetical protein
MAAQPTPIMAIRGKHGRINHHAPLLNTSLGTATSHTLADLMAIMCSYSFIRHSSQYSSCDLQFGCSMVWLWHCRGTTNHLQQYSTEAVQPPVEALRQAADMAGGSTAAADRLAQSLPPT